MRFANILFPVDFSERCRTVAPFVKEATRRDGAALTLVSFIDAPLMWYGTAEAPCIPALDISGMIEETTNRLGCFAGDFFPGTHTRTAVEEGDPGSSIVEFARASAIDLIMMPTRGHGRFRTALLGSVTAKVLHDAECPVWTAAHPETPGYSDSCGAPDTKWRSVVCAVDATPGASRLIRYAGEIASAYGASVHLVHAVPPPVETLPGKYLNREFENCLKESARQAINGMQREAGTDFRVCIEAGNVSTVVAAAAQSHEADLALIGRGVLSHFAGRLRTQVYAIIRDVPCPVLSI
jgi:nucleotide-binding universal stress UspA family protein